MKRYVLTALILTLLGAGAALAQNRVLVIASTYGKGTGPFTNTITTPLTAGGYSVRTWIYSSTIGWPRLDTLLNYDAVFFHGSERSTAKGADSVLAAYAAQGGRVVAEGSNLAQWACVYPELQKRVTHAKWHGANVTGYTYEIVDSGHPLTAGLPATFPSSGYGSGNFPDIAEPAWGGHTVIRYQNQDNAAAVITYPRSVFFNGSLHRVSNAAARDSLIVRAVRWVLTDPGDAAVYDVNYEYGHRAGENIPVQIALKNWAIAEDAVGTLVLESSADSVNWVVEDSTTYLLGASARQTYTLLWHPPLAQLYQLRATIRPTGADSQSESNTGGVQVITLIPGDHPRLFFRAGDVDGLRSRAATTHLQFAQALQGYVNANLNYQVPQPGSWQMANISQISSVLSCAALQAVLNPSPTYVNLAKRLTMDLCRLPNWSTGFTDQDIYPARGGLALAQAYDWLYHEFSPAQQDTIRLKLVTQFERMEAAYPHGIWWTETLFHNHNWHSMDNFGAAVFSVLGEDPRAQRWHESAVQNLDHRMFYYGPVEDGSWYEAPNYWGLISWPFLTHLYLLREQAGLNYFDLPFVRSLPTYRLHCSLPDLDRMPMVNEAQNGEWFGPEDQLALIAAETRDGEAQWLQARVIEQAGYSLDGPLYFFFYDPSVPQTLPTELSKLIPDQDSYFARSSWSANATYFSLKCGVPCGRHAFTTYWSPGGAIDEFAFSHFHPDQGAFTIYHNGRYVIQSSGLEHPRHYTRSSTTMMVNGRGQIGDSTLAEWAFPPNPLNFNPRLTETHATPRTDYVIADATSAYPAGEGLRLFERRFLYIRPATFVVLDRLRANTPSTFSFMLQHRSDVWTYNSSRVLITDGTVQMTMHPLMPQEWTVHESFNWYYRQEWGGWAFRLTNFEPDTAVRFFNVISPVQGGEAQAQLLVSNDVFSAMRHTTPQGLASTVLIRYALSDSVTTTGLRTNAELAVVQHDTVSGALQGVTLKNGSLLRWGPAYELLFHAPEPTDLEWDDRGDTLSFSGRFVAGMRVLAPQASVILFEGQPVEYSRDGDYIVFTGVIAPPRAITNLTIAALGDSVRLRWTRVQENIFGEPVSVVGYTIYRSVGHNSGEELVAEVSPADSVYTAPLAPVGPNLPVFYEVRAHVESVTARGRRDIPAEADNRKQRLAPVKPRPSR